MAPQCPTMEPLRQAHPMASSAFMETAPAPRCTRSPLNCSLRLPRGSSRPPAAGHPADTCLDSQVLGRLTICVKEGKEPGHSAPYVPTGGGLSTVITASKATAGTQAQRPAHGLWGIGRLPGQPRIWLVRRTGLGARLPTGHSILPGTSGPAEPLAKSNHHTDGSDHI